MNPESIAGNLEVLIQNQSLREKMIEDLKLTAKGNESEIIKFQEIIHQK